MNKQDCQYEPLPGSDSKADQSNNDANEGPSSQKSKVHHLNKYALAGAILASTNSILLGYGEFHFF